MAAAPNAARMTANALAHERGLIAREARDLADAAARFAADVGRALACGDAQHIADTARRLELRAAKITAMQNTADLYNADLDPQDTA